MKNEGLMRAMVLERKGAIESAPLVPSLLPLPEPGAGELRIKVRYCAICRTDLHVIEGDLPEKKLPLVPGHQIVGVVEKCAPGGRFKIGDRVGAAWLYSTCGGCEYCLEGKENLCESSEYTGYTKHGGFAEYMLAKEDFCYELPAEIDDKNAAPLLCAGIIGYRALKRSNLPEGGRLGIFGFGSSAHIVIQLARQREAEVLVVTRAREHQELARDLGAAWAGSEARELSAPLDSAVIFAPAGELVPAALESLKKGGTLAVAGIHMSAIPPLNYDQHLFFERDLRSVTANTRRDGEELLSAVSRRPLDLRTRIYPLEAANKALRDLKEDLIQGTGILEP